MRGTEWRSVRKIRRVAEIEELLRMSDRGGAITTELVRENLIRSRMRTSQTYLGLTRRRLKNYPTFAGTNSFLQLASDRIAFARKIGIWIGDSHSIRLTPLGVQLKSALETPDRKIKILEILLASPYSAYRGFVNHIASIGGKFEIPATLRLRTKGDSREYHHYLQNHGFLTDGASFHAIKDLFYDFGFLNWRVFKDGKERIYLTRTIYGYETMGIMKDICAKVKHTIPTQSSLPSEVANALVDAYIRMGFPLSEFHDILPLRDEATEKLLISDQEFAEHLHLIATNPEIDARVKVGVGPLVEKIPLGYGLKLVTLPRLLEDEPITRIMVSQN